MNIFTCRTGKAKDNLYSRGMNERILWCKDEWMRELMMNEWIYLHLKPEELKFMSPWKEWRKEFHDEWIYPHGKNERISWWKDEWMSEGRNLRKGLKERINK